jgi:hypothetical protein
MRLMQEKGIVWHCVQEESDFYQNYLLILSGYQAGRWHHVTLVALNLAFIYPLDLNSIS